MDQQIPYGTGRTYPWICQQSLEWISGLLLTKDDINATGTDEVNVIETPAGFIPEGVGEDSYLKFATDPNVFANTAKNKTGINLLYVVRQSQPASPCEVQCFPASVIVINQPED
ncbi:MAG: hypothetical protein ACLT8E_01075 [Akkermansia sp.]